MGKEGGGKAVAELGERELIEREGEMKEKEGRGFCKGNGFGRDRNLIDLGREIEGPLAPDRRSKNESCSKLNLISNEE